MAFHSLEEIQKSCREKNVLFWRAVLLEDMADRSVTETESMQSMQQMWTAMKSASEQYEDVYKRQLQVLLAVAAAVARIWRRLVERTRQESRKH